MKADLRRVAGGGAARERGDGARVLGGVAVVSGRSVAGGRRLIPGAAADAGGERGDAVADEDAVREAGFFYEAWARGGPGWARVEVRAEECPRIGRAFLEEERLTDSRDGNPER
jgi:hypothetical protein